MPKIEVGDIVTIKAEVTRVSDNGADMTLRIPLHGYAVTVPVNAAATVQKPPKRKPIYDTPD